jgi:hypothetical protein
LEDIEAVEANRVIRSLIYILVLSLYTFFEDIEAVEANRVIQSLIYILVLSLYTFFDIRTRSRQQEEQ